MQAAAEVVAVAAVELLQTATVEVQEVPDAVQLPESAVVVLAAAVVPRPAAHETSQT